MEPRNKVEGDDRIPEGGHASGSGTCPVTRSCQRVVAPSVVGSAGRLGVAPLYATVTSFLDEFVRWGSTAWVVVILAQRWALVDG